MQNHEDFIMKPKVDFCFKELMEDAEIRRGFISAVLNVKPEEIEKTELLPTHLRKTYLEEKFGILDVRVKIIGEHASDMDMEIQVAPFELWAERSLFYLCKMFFSQIQEGETYEKLKKCIHVGILDFVLFKNVKEFYSCFHFWEDQRRQKYTDKLEIHIIELPKWNLENRQDKTGTERAELKNWARFLHAESKEELEMAANTNSYLAKAYNLLGCLSMDEEKRREYEAREKAIRDYDWQMESNWRRGHETGREEGIKQGIEQGIRQGVEQGISAGMEKKLVEQVCQKLRKGKEAKMIAEDLEEDLEAVVKICQTAQRFAPDYDSELVLKGLSEDCPSLL